ncbi:MAG: EamA family transporter, partial [Anaerolineae bacterium]
MLSIFYGLSSAITWGAADFCGGLASRRSRAYQAVLLGEGVGMLLLLVISLFFHEDSLSLRGWLFCALAGALGVIGLLLFFTSLANGRMSVVAPVSALTATIIPVVFGSLLEGFPGFVTFAGFLLAL